MTAMEAGGEEMRSRLQRAEELLGFAEHRMDELHGSLLELGRTVDALSRRLGALESRLATVVDGLEGEGGESGGEA